MGDEVQEKNSGTGVIYAKKLQSSGQLGRGEMGDEVQEKNSGTGVISAKKLQSPGQLGRWEVR
jgi:hypothetical protein